MAGFRVGEDDFEVDGRPVRLLSGALHYFRVHEEQWGHRLAMLRAMGLNCVETYVPWNLHEPRPGELRDVGALGRFLDAVREAGLWAIVRPGPYICAEWENGGLPHWLTGPLGSRVRTRDGEFLAAVDRWFAALLPQVVERQFGRGGPVIMVQVENEYGSYGSDQVYLAHLADGLRGLGVTVPLFTSDGPDDHMLTGGSVPGVLATANFGSNARGGFETLRRHRPKGPLMCMEFWCGWFDHWGADHVVRDAQDAAAALREILECGASVNLYMAHGGTSFGGWAGANRAGQLHEGLLQPDVTSYDYDAPVDEHGRPTEKFWRFREVLAEYADEPLPDVPEQPAALASTVTAELTSYAPLDAVLDELGSAEGEYAVPPTFEELDVDRGWSATASTCRGRAGRIRCGWRGCGTVPWCMWTECGPGCSRRTSRSSRSPSRDPRASSCGWSRWAGSTTGRARVSRRASRAGCCTSGSICTGCGRGRCVWTRSTTRTRCGAWPRWTGLRGRRACTAARSR